MIDDINQSVLLFEPEHAGHQMEYLLLFSKSIVQKNIKKLTLVISPMLLEKLEENLEWHNLKQLACVQVLLFTAIELNKCNDSRLFLRSFSLWKTVFKYAKKTQADDVVSMRIDHFQLALALRLPMKARITGILFQPFLHYNDSAMLGSSGITWRGRIKSFRQKVLYTGMLNHPCMHVLFSLDDSFVVWGKKNLLHGDKIHFLPDPSHPEVEKCSDSPIKYLIGNIGQRTVFLLFGALSRRKGVFELLSALRLLSQKERDKLYIVFAGKVLDDDKEQFLSQLSALKSLDKNCCTIINYFLSTDEIITLLHHCDVVLACYQCFVGSSGILLWAASAGKPVIAQDYGLVGKWVQDHQLGLAVNTSNSSMLADAMIQLCDKKRYGKHVDNKYIKEFSNTHHPEQFAKIFTDVIVAS